MSEPEWRRRLAERAPLGDWFRRRHHCSEDVLGQSRDVDKPCYTEPQRATKPDQSERTRQ